MAPSAAVLGALRALAEAEGEMTRTLEAVRPLAEDARRRCAVAEDGVLRFAYRLRKTAAPPSEWTPEAPMVAFLPPTPTPEIMRAGALGADNAAPPP